MKIKRVLACVVLGLAASVAVADEPTSIAGVRILVIRDASATPESGICIDALDARLSVAGFTVLNTVDGADAELSATMSFAAEGRGLMGLTASDDVNVTYSILIKSIPSRHLLFSLIEDEGGGSLANACVDAATDIVEKVLKAKEPPAPPKSKKAAKGAQQK